MQDTGDTTSETLLSIDDAVRQIYEVTTVLLPFAVAIFFLIALMTLVMFGIWFQGMIRR